MGFVKKKGIKYLMAQVKASASFLLGRADAAAVFPPQFLTHARRTLQAAIPIPTHRL
jgi:hypothetical protein